MEVGANVISEAIVDGTAVLASRIPGSVGLLGADYPGFYPFGDTQALRNLLLRAETDSMFYRELLSRCAKLSPLFRPARERAAWKRLLDEVTPSIFRHLPESSFIPPPPHPRSASSISDH